MPRSGGKVKIQHLSSFEKRLLQDRVPFCLISSRAPTRKSNQHRLSTIRAVLSAIKPISESANFPMVKHIRIIMSLHFDPGCG